MNEMVNTQTLLFLKAIEIGILMGMVYDLVRIFRKIIPHPNWVVQVEDLLYWISCGFLCFGLLYVYNYSDIRIFVFLGIFLGGLLYFLTFSILFMKIATWVIDLVKQIITYCIHIISIPVRWVIRVLSIPLNYLRRQGRKLRAYTNQRRRVLDRRLYQQRMDHLTERKVRGINKYLQEEKK